MSNELYNNGYITKIQKLFRKNKFKKICIQLNNLNLNEKIKQYEFNEFKQYIQKKNIKSILKKFIKSYYLLINEEIITIDEFCLVYLIYGYHTIIFNNKKNKEITYIIDSSKNIVAFINNIVDCDFKISKNLHNNLYNFHNAFNYYTSYNTITNCSPKLENKICKIDIIINKFYDSFMIYKTIYPTSNYNLDILIDEQLECIYDIYKLDGHRGIVYLINNLRNNIDLDSLAQKIKNKLNLYDKII
jgi:hypothetical protein